MNKKLNKFIELVLKKSDLFALGVFLPASIVFIMESIRVNPAIGYIAFIVALFLSAMASMIVRCVYGIMSKNVFYSSGDLFFPIIMFIFSSVTSLYYVNLLHSSILIFLIINLITVAVPILIPYIAHRFYGIEYKLEEVSCDSK
ncbi:MAG: hypothetical protein KBB86_00030 [Candidatus Pacebacteria bacterium]|nr:hypothetical protein [Candidatus Paceibacterota bacterium]